MSSVWCQVVMPDGIKMGSPVFINPVPENIAVLCEVVKTKMEITLNYCDADNLIVFPPGTTDLTDEKKGYERWIECPGAAGENPLIVVAPLKESGTSCMVVLIPPTSHNLFHHARKQFSLFSKIFQRPARHLKIVVW